MRQGRKSLEESWLDKWIEENRLEGKKAKTLTDEEREKTWFTMPFTGQKVKYSTPRTPRRTSLTASPICFRTGAGAVAGLTLALPRQVRLEAPHSLWQAWLPEGLLAEYPRRLGHQGPVH